MALILAISLKQADDDCTSIAVETIIPNGISNGISKFSLDLLKIDFVSIQFRNWFNNYSDVPSCDHKKN